MRKRLLLLSVTTVVVLAGCAPARFVQPLQKGEHAIGFDLGGPLFEFSGMNIPAPLSSLYYGFGLDSNLTLFGSLHTTSLAFANFQTDFGATWKFYRQDGYIPNLSLTAAGNYIFHFGDPNMKFWPQLDINAYWEHGEYNSYVYAGLDSWFELAKLRAHEQKTPDHWMMNPTVGYVYKTKTWDYNLELKFLAPGYDHTYVLVDYRGITGKYGSTGIYLNITKRF